MKLVNAVVHVHESESESMELSWIIHGLVLKAWESLCTYYLPMEFHRNNMGIRGGIRGFPWIPLHFSTFVYGAGGRWKRGSGKHGSGKRGTRWQGWKTREWNLLWTKRTRRHQRQRQSRQNRQRQLQQPLTTAARCVWHHSRVSHSLVSCGHAGFCESCALRVADLDSCCPVCRAPIIMHSDARFFLMTLCTQLLLRSFVGFALLFNTYFA